MNRYLKALKRARIADIVSWIVVKVSYTWIGFWGTLCFKIKAIFLGIEGGKGVKCFGRVDIIRAPFSLITLGDNCSIVSSSYRCTASSIYAPTKFRTFASSARIFIGNNVGLNGTSIVARTKSIYIGDGTMIAPNCVIMDSDFHALWPPENRENNPALERDKDIFIGKNVWIGSQVIILKGVTIGDNSIIAAGSLVARDIPASVLAGGNPARVIKELNEGE